MLTTEQESQLSAATPEAQSLYKLTMIIAGALELVRRTTFVSHEGIEEYIKALAHVTGSTLGLIRPITPGAKADFLKIFNEAYKSTSGK